MALTVDDLKLRVETDLDDVTLQRILNAAVQSVNRSAGSASSETETFVDARGLRFLPLSRRGSAIASVTERISFAADVVTLAADDYRLVGAYRLLRITNGTNPASSWGTEVEVTYTPEVDQDLRDRVALDLCQVDIEFRAYERESAGDWEGEQKEYAARRRELLKQVREGASLVV